MRVTVRGPVLLHPGPTAAFTNEMFMLETERLRLRRFTLADESVQRATRQAREASTALSASLDSAQAETFAAYEAARDSVDAANASTIANLEAETASLRIEVGLLGGEVVALREAFSAERARADNLQAANESLRRALAGQKRQGRLLKVGGAALLGLAIYDRVSG
jgi:hypothetical protein